jgi:organic hydroperoxide reductase OsmC/OhrA
MLWYLHLAAVAGVVVVAYTDSPVGSMDENDDGSGQFSRVLLRPVVTVSRPEMVSTAQALHSDAHTLCFIARSMNFAVDHEPTAVVQPPTPGG